MCYQKRLKMIPEYELNQGASSQELTGTVDNSQQNDAHSHGSPVDETMITSTDDALSVLSIVRDLSSSSGTLKRQEIVLDGTRPVRDLFEEVGRRFGFEPDSFNLLLQRRSEGLVVRLDQHLDQTLENAGFALSLESRNQVQIEDKAGKPPRPSDTAGSAQGANLSLNLNTSNQLPMITAGPSSYPSYSRQSSAPGFVGLVNQAMTCYLNSLLQTLYMTPEFRNALYQWKFDGTPDEAVKSIPFQLQKLFLLLQTSKKSAVETTELTRSFGWDSSEAWQQHDIQELCRVMFDALEHKFKGTEHADLISRLYEGKMIDYVKCLECGLEKAREDTFLDVPLPVRPFGSMVAFSSIEESLKAFVQPETLDGNNQYHCEKCAKKCDAHKGLKFSKFPYLLTLHLKRFDFDYSTLQRIKLNDRVTFPELLELNSFLKDARESAADTEDCLSECTDLDDDASHRTHSSKLSDIESQIGEDDEGIDVTTSSSDSERLKRRALESGPYAYELFSIMIHSGSASGGHYYAYVKDFRTGAWNCFNDQTVTRLTPEDIEKSYGGSSNRSYYSSAYSSSTNAYMLIYRQIDRTRNTEPISAEQFPPHIKALITELAQQDEAERSVKERERSHFKIKLFCNHPQKGKIEVPWYVAKDLKLKEALSLAYDKLSLTDVLPVERCRLVTYSEFHDSLESSLEGKEDETLYYLLTAFGSIKYDLLMELDKEGRGFSVYSSAGCTVKIFRLNVEDSIVTGPANTHFSFATTVQEFRESVAKLCYAKTDRINVLWESSTHFFTHLSDSDKSLKQEGFGRSNKVYVETSGEQFDIVRQVIEDVNNRTVMHVSVPPITQEMLDRDSIPTLAEYHTATSVATYNLVRETAACSGAQEYYSSEALSINRWALKEGEGTSDEEIGNVSIGSTSPQPASPLNTDDCDLIDVDQDLSSDRRFEAGDHSASEDSSLTDSDRTLMGDPPEECVLRAPSPQLPSPSDHHLHLDQVDSRKVDDASHVLHLVVPRFFRVDEITKENNDKVYKLTVDRRMHLGELKRHIEPYVNVPCDFFRVFKVQASSGIDRECVNLNETLETIGEEPWLTVRLGRALKPGEIRGKVYHLQPNEAEPVSGSFLFEWILAPGTSVRQVRQDLWKESQKHGIDVPLERFSVRKKSWRSPGKVFADHETVGDENIPLYANWELFIQILPEDREARCVPEGCREDCVVTLFLRRWRPSEFVLEPFREVTFGSYESEPIKSKISELCGIPLESVQIAKPPGVFPCDMSILRIEADLDWERNPRSIEDQPYSILEDGGILFWRDNRETLKELTEDERKAITIRENARLQRNNTYTASPSSRKEKALKIYYDPVVPSLTDVSVD